MPAWSWWLIFGGIVVFGAVVFALIGLNLWRRSKVLFGDLQRLSAVAESLESALGGDSMTPATTLPPAAGRHRARS